jgi:endonuclease YncB( thermonuclease family)
MIPRTIFHEYPSMPRLPVLSLLLVATACGGDTPDAISGRVTVVDGDSFEIGETRVRLNAIDAPEGRQTCVRGGAIWRCGTAAAAKLRALVAGRTVSCTKKDEDSYHRMVAVCSNGSADLGSAMVSAGLALAYRQYGDDYAAEENAARAARRGLWASEFTPPWELRRSEAGTAQTPRPRRENRSDRPSRAAAPQGRAGCVIKGNISDAGKIYHVLGSAHYDETRIDESKGERWFCSTQEARGAGWRAPKD